MQQYQCNMNPWKLASDASRHWLATYISSMTQNIICVCCCWVYNSFKKYLEKNAISIDLKYKMRNVSTMGLEKHNLVSPLFLIIKSYVHSKHNSMPEQDTMFTATQSTHAELQKAMRSCVCMCSDLLFTNGILVI